MIADKEAVIGYFVPEFPSQTHIFFWREFFHIRSQGLNCHLLSSKRPDQPCLHSFASEAMQQTYYAYPPPWLSSLKYLVSHPLAVLKSFRRLLSLRGTGWFTGLGLLMCAAGLTDHCKKQGIQHVHFHSCADSALLGLLINALGRIPYSLTLHGDLSVYGQDHRAKFASASFVSVVTSALKEQVVGETQIDPERVPVIWMGVDTRKFKPAQAEDPVEHASDPNDAPARPLRLITVARLHPAKGHRDALEAIRRSVDEGIEVSYRIIGGGDAAGDIRRRIEELQLQSHVELLGEQSEEQVLSLLQSSDVFLLPSLGKGEAAPVAVMEAMSCGLAVIATIIGGTPEMIQSGENGLLVPQRDIDAMHRAIHSLWANPDQRQRLSQKARQTAQERYDTQVGASRLIEAIRTHRPAGGQS